MQSLVRSYEKVLCKNCHHTKIFLAPLLAVFCIGCAMTLIGMALLSRRKAQSKIKLKIKSDKINKRMRLFVQRWRQSRLTRLKREDYEVSRFDSDISGTKDLYTDPYNVIQSLQESVDELLMYGSRVLRCAVHLGNLDPNHIVEDLPGTKQTRAWAQLAHDNILTLFRDIGIASYHGTLLPEEILARCNLSYVPTTPPPTSGSLSSRQYSAWIKNLPGPPKTPPPIE
jgi:hypothetical protein